MTNLAKQIEAAIDDNMHTEAAMIGARAMNNDLGNAFAFILQEIQDTHELQGYMEKEQQVLRDVIAKEVNSYIKAMGLV